MNSYSSFCSKKLLVLVFLISVLPAKLMSQESIKISRISAEVNFDGIPDEALWNEATVFPMVVHYPSFGAEPSEISEVMIGYDEEYLYVAARLYSKDPDNITATSKKRDEESRNSDQFGIILDTYDDNENALAFFTMPTAARIDYTVSNDAEGGGGGGMGSINRSWNTFWDVETTRDEHGWYVEMRIPFSSLRFQTIDGKIRMGMILNRRISYMNETVTFPLIDPKYGFSANFKPSLAQTIEFENIKARKPVYIAPYALGGYSSSWELNEEETEYIQKDEPTLEAGLDVKYSLTSNLTVDLTANTDFAQVEADDQQVNLTRYSLFFPEKRLFFQERSGIFNFSLGGRSDNLFYSRRIGIVDDDQVRIYGGARMTGRINKWDVGILDMQTQSHGETPSENFGVARLRRQVINQNSYVGGIMTSRIGTNGNYNVAYGLDGIIRMFGDDYLDVRFAQTYETGAENKVFSTDPTFVGITWERRTDEGFAYDLNYTFTGEEMNPDMGFLRRNDIQGMGGRLQYGWIYGESSKLFSSRAMFQVRRYNRVSDGSLESMEISPGWFINSKKGLGAFMEIKYMKEGVDEDFDLSDDVVISAGEYAFTAFETMIFTPSSKRISARIKIEAGGFYDGNIVSVGATPILNLSASLQLSGTYQFNTIHFPDRDQSMQSHIGRASILYMYSTKLSTSAFVQVNSANDVFVGNFRIRYNPREGNDLYLVYNEYRGFMVEDDAVPEPPSYYNRAILLKYTHTFRL
ncbi:MAG: carbohydrate binding family 9 domain-containing protein [Bacteroidetes bacterium]|nr:carbohydrate binding family 9 domain-containing protein [Bacteroidota bacterium]